MKTCQFCGKEFEDELNICPICGGKETEPQSEAAENALTEAEETTAEEHEHVEDIPEPQPVKRKKKRKKTRGWASAIIAIIFPSIGLGISLIAHISIIIATVVIALILPYLLALTPIALPVAEVCTIIVSIIACFFCFIGFFLSIVALVKKNLLGIAGLSLSILSPIAIIVMEVVAIATPYLLQFLTQLIPSLVNMF